MRKAIMYTEATIEEQGGSRSELRRQAEKLREFSRRRGAKIMAHIEEDYSPKNYGKLEWNYVIDYIKMSKKARINVLIVARWNRLAKTVDGVLEKIDALNSLGVEVISSEQPLDLYKKDTEERLTKYLFPYGQK